MKNTGFKLYVCLCLQTGEDRRRRRRRVRTPGAVATSVLGVEAAWRRTGCRRVSDARRRGRMHRSYPNPVRRPPVRSLMACGNLFFRNSNNNEKLTTESRRPEPAGRGGGALLRRGRVGTGLFLRTGWCRLFFKRSCDTDSGTTIK